VAGNILWTVVRAGATVLKEMVVETTYNASINKLPCIGGETNELTGICHNKP
jgi:hypothetical protein